MSTINIQPLDVIREAHWSFRDSAPTWRGHVSGTSSTFDPFPAYAHNLEAVRAAVAHVTDCWAPAWDVDLYVANREEVGRSNGYSNVWMGGHYVNGEWTVDPPRGLIVMSGKRIPIHPAMTRYLVAHEYGHNVEWMLNIARGAKNATDEALIREYAEIRGLPEETLHHGEGGTWHDSASEVFACDFRVLVCQSEVEFWPHPTVPRPEGIPAISEWWLQARSLHSSGLVAVAAE
jgi:hypothetical protein